MITFDIEYDAESSDYANSLHCNQQSLRVARLERIVAERERAVGVARASYHPVAVVNCEVEQVALMAIRGLLAHAQSILYRYPTGMVRESYSSALDAAADW